MKLINKLTLGHLIVGLFVIVVALVGMETINNINFTFNEISEQTLPALDAIEHAKAAGLKIVGSTSEFALLRAESKSNLTGLDIEKENIILARKEYDAAISQYEELVNKFFPDEKGLAENVKNSGKKLQNASNELITLKEQGVSGEIVLEKWDEFEAAEQEFLKAIDGVIAHEHEEIAQRKQSVERTISTSVKTILIAGLLTFTIAIVLGARISKSISDPITKLKSAAIDLGKGKLDTRVDIKSRDEVGILAACFNQMAQNLQQAGGELRKSEEKFRSITAGAMDAIVSMDEQGRIYYLNPAGERIFGYTTEEVAGKDLHTFLVPEKYHDSYIKGFEGFKATGKGRVIGKITELSALRKDGTEFPVEISVSAFTTQDGWHSVGIIRDITERKLAEEALRENEEKFRLVFENARDAVFWANPETGLIIRCNKAAENLLEKENREIVGHHQSTLHPPEKAEYYASVFKKHIQQKGSVDEEAEVITKSGKIKPVQISASVTIVREKPIMQGIFRDITERKLADNALKESEERHRSLVEFSPYGIAIHSEGKLVFVNQAGARILGAANPEELIGIPVLQIIHPDYRELVKERIRMQEEGKVAPLIEEKLLRLDGTSVDVEITSIPFTYKGKPAMYGVFLDITERKRAEEALRKSELLLSEAERIAHLGNWEWDMQTNVLRWSDETYRILGYSPGEITPYYDTFLNAIHPEDREHVEKAIADAMSKKKPYNIEHRMVWKDGSVVAVHSLGEITLDSSGKPIRMIGTVLDITERKRAEEALKESEEKYRALINDASDAIFLANDKGNLLETNKKAEELTGYTKEELSNMNMIQIHPKEELERTIGTFKEMIEKGSGSLNDAKVLRKDGKTVPVDIAGNVIEYAGKKVIQGIFRDITERKMVEELHLENERLVYANQAKSEFLAVMSHELRTPLNAVIGFSELLKRGMAGELNEKQGHYVDNVMASGKHLLTLINDILDIAKVEAGKMELAIEEISVPSVTDDVLVLIKEKAAKHKVILNKEFDPRLDVIEADKTKFKQILFNLLDNAVKFSKEEGGTVTITTKKLEDMAKISISDTGIGIKEEDMGKLFTMFQQLDSGFSRNHGGAGLGLAISKQFVELHGGKIMVESKYGVGSTFTFMLPLKAKDTK